MKLEVFFTSDRSRWREALTRFRPADDIYYTPGYSVASEANQEGEARCYFVEHEGDAILIPLFRAQIPQNPGLFDYQTAYGYGGPVTLSQDENFLEKAWELLLKTWAEEQAVAVFLRCHPLARNHEHLRGPWLIREDRKTRSIDLRNGLAGAFDGPECSKHRRDAAKARRDGVEVICRESFDILRLKAFHKLYCDTMRSLGAKESYFFPPAYFEALVSELHGNISLFEAVDRTGATLCAAFILWGTHWAHYHLSGRTASSANASHLLLTAVAEQASERGLSLVHLGGGRSTAPDDSLLRFKSWIGRCEHSFHTASVILRPSSYHELVEGWKEANPGAVPTWALAYRQTHC